jgi:hypothetical protein
VHIHLGVEPDFRPAKKAHPALRTERFEELLTQLAANHIQAIPDGSSPSMRRFYVADCFGNRLEIIAV